MTTTAEASRKIRAALKSAFPSAKFTVALSAGHSISWHDDGPSVVEVQDALLAAGCGEARTGWNDTRYIEIEGDTLVERIALRCVGCGRSIMKGNYCSECVDRFGFCEGLSLLDVEENAS